MHGEGFRSGVCVWELEVQTPGWTPEQSRQKNYFLSPVMAEIIWKSQVQKQTRDEEEKEKQESIALQGTDPGLAKAWQRMSRKAAASALGRPRIFKYCDHYRNNPHCFPCAIQETLTLENRLFVSAFFQLCSFIQEHSLTPHIPLVPQK